MPFYHSPVANRQLPFAVVLARQEPRPPLFLLSRSKSALMFFAINYGLKSVAWEGSLRLLKHTAHAALFELATAPARARVVGSDFAFRLFPLAQNFPD